MQEVIPGLDPERGLGPLRDQIPEHYGDVGGGWRDILERAHAAALESNPDYRVTQVKEKFGGLRLYLVGVGGAVTDPFEQESYTTCERCGKPGALRRPGGWYLTLCAEHTIAREAEVAAQVDEMNRLLGIDED